MEGYGVKFLLRSWFVWNVVKMECNKLTMYSIICKVTTKRITKNVSQTKIKWNIKNRKETRRIKE